MIDRIIHLRPRLWQHELTGLRIRLPDDTRTFRVVKLDADGYEVEATSRRFRSLYTAHSWCSQQTGA
jgi:hypothetical protein